MQLLKKISNTVFLLFIFLLAISASLNERFIQVVPLILLMAMFIPGVNRLIKLKIELYNKRTQVLLIVLFFALYLFAGKYYVPTSIYKTPADKKELMGLYNQFYKEWPAGTQEQTVNNSYGKIHLLVCGPAASAPMLLFPAENLSAVSWKENIEVFSKNHRCYVIDPIGEAGKSQLSDLKLFPRTGKEIVHLYLEVADSLHLKKTAVAGVSAGARIAMLIAAQAPERVDSLFLIAPLGLTKPSNLLMWSTIAPAMFPIPVLERMCKNYLLDHPSEQIQSTYGKWIQAAIHGTISYSAYPNAIPNNELEKITAPSLVILAQKDQIAGFVKSQRAVASKLAHVTVREVEGSHFLSIEHPEKVNHIIENYMNKR